MNSKSEKLFKLLEKLGFWHQGLPLKDLYPKNKEIVNTMTYIASNSN